MNASGCLCTTYDELDNLNNCEYINCFISKSATLKPKIGNEKPRLYWEDNLSINSMGLANNGLDYYNKYDLSIKDNDNEFDDKIYMQSIAPKSIEELHEMLESLVCWCKRSQEELIHFHNKKSESLVCANEHSHGDTNIGGDKKYVEINLSCPNIDGKMISRNFQLLREYIESLENIDHIDDLILGLKLPSYVESWEFDEVADIIRNSNIKFITCINSKRGLVIRDNKNVIKPNNGFGGIGGSSILPESLYNVRNFYMRLKDDNIEIIGCGGVTSGLDAYQHILCGASMVQIGTAYLNEGIGVFERIYNELLEVMGLNKYTNIEEFRGTLGHVSD